MLELRPASIADSDRLLAWRNDPQTRAMSLSTDVISGEDHKRWMDMNVVYGYPTHIVMIGEIDEKPVGVVRFDASKKDVMSYTASITMAPAERGKGLAHGVLDQACLWMGEFTLNATIRASNVPSQKLFEKCGFEQIDAAHDLLRYRRKPL